MSIINLNKRRTETTVKGITGNIFKQKSLRLIDKKITVYKLTPKEAEELTSKGYTLIWVHKKEKIHDKPKVRLYYVSEPTKREKELRG